MPTSGVKPAAESEEDRVQRAGEQPDPSTKPRETPRRRGAFCDAREADAEQRDGGDGEEEEERPAAPDAEDIPFVPVRRARFAEVEHDRGHGWQRGHADRWAVLNPAAGRRPKNPRRKQSSALPF